MHRVWITEVSKTCRRQQAWKSRTAVNSMVGLKINNFMLLFLSTSSSWTVWIIRALVIVNNSKWWVVRRTTIQVYFEDILATETYSTKIWKREKQGPGSKLRRLVTRARQCQVWMKFWHSCIKTLVSGRDIKIIAELCLTAVLISEELRTPSLITYMATLDNLTRSKSNQMVVSPKIIRLSR